MRNLVKNLAHGIGFDIRKQQYNPEYSLLGLRTQPFGTVLDVGANTGQFARRAAELFPEASIVSFEPLPDAFEKLQRWALKHAPRTHAIQVALGDSDGVVQMYRHVEHTVSSSLLSSTDENGRLYPVTRAQQKVGVKVRRLDSLAAEFAPWVRDEVLVKLDVQGFEDRVIRGGMHTIGRASACIVELNLKGLYDGQARVPDIVSLFDDLGFDYAGNISQHCDPGGRVNFIDALFRKRERNIGRN
jgi:FkbM family methyltransferase